MSSIGYKSSMLTLACVTVLLSTGCDKATKVAGEVAQKAGSTASAGTAVGYKFNLKDGPAACLGVFQQKIGSDFKVLDFSTYYVLPASIDASSASSYKGTSGGEMKTCDLKIQDPADLKKAVGYKMNVNTGDIQGPIPVEISVTGNADSFKLSDVVYPVKNIDFAAIQQNIDSIKPKLDEKFSVYQVSGIRMDSDLRTGKPHILVHIDGKLKANDIKKNVLLHITPDGKKVTLNSMN